MDLVNIGRSRRFLRERPIRVNLFDRPRMVCDLLCLEVEQTEKRRGLATSDSLYVVIEGRARLQSGPQIEEMQEQDAALIPPGVDHTIENLGPGRLTVMVLVTPKPSRAGEVRMPAEGRPQGRAFRDDGPPPRPPRREYEEEPQRDRPRPRRGFDGPPPRQRPAPRTAAPRARREGGEAEGPVWFPRPKPAWRPRGAPPAGAGRGGPARAFGPPRSRGGPPAGARGRPERPEGISRASAEGGRSRSDRPAGASGWSASGVRGRPGRPDGARGASAEGGRSRSERPAGARGGPPSGPRGRAGPPGTGGPRGGRGGGPSQPDRRGGSRGRPPPRPSARPAPGRSAPRTSGRRQSRES